MQLICETLLPPRMSVTIIFWTLSSYTLQPIVIVTTAIFIPVYLFIARPSRDYMSGLTSCQIRCVTHQISIGYISAPFLNGFTCSFQHNNLLFPGYKVIYNRGTSGGRETRRGGSGGRMLTRQISSECVNCVGFRWPKTAILADFDIFRSSVVPTPFYRWRPTLVCMSRPKVYTYPPNFNWMCSLYRLPVAKNHNFWQILTFWSSCINPLLPMRAKFGML